MELKTYLTILARRWQIILVVVLATISVSVYASRYVSYQAETRLQVITPMGGSLGDTYHETTFATRLMNTYAQIATSDQLKSELKEKLNLATLPDINVKIIPDSEIIQIIVESRDPALAARAANGLAELIIAPQDKTVVDSASSEEINILNNRKLELETSFAQSQQEYNTLVQNYSQTSAKIAILEKTIARKELAYQNNPEQYQSDKELEALNQQYEELLTSFNEYSQQLLMIRQTMQNDQNAYANLLSRYDSALSAQLRKERTQNILIISPAVEPSQPTLSRFFIVALGLICGLVVGIMCAFLFDNLDTRIFTPEQIGALTTLPVLGSFPLLHKHKGDFSTVLQGDYLMSRKRIFQSLRNKQAKTILVTSPNPLEGKSIVSTGLAVSLADYGFKVLIVDANLRRPQQQILHSISDGQDLCTFLKDRDSQLEDAIRKNVKPGVDLLPCLSESDDPTELLQSNRLRELFKKVETYDFVLIDTPALLAVPDVYTLTTFVDSVLIVIQKGRTTSGDIQSACKYLEDVDTKLLGIVLNQMPMKVAVSYSHPGTGWLNRIRISAEKLVSARS